MIDPLTALAFSIYENKGVYCLMRGSGVSRPAEIPTGWEITLDLVRRITSMEALARIRVRDALIAASEVASATTTAENVPSTPSAAMVYW